MNLVPIERKPQKSQEGWNVQTKKRVAFFEEFLGVLGADESKRKKGALVHDTQGEVGGEEGFGREKVLY